MYVPPFDSLLRAVGMTQAEFERSTRVTVPSELLKLLLQVAVANSNFNAKGYLKTNPDVAEAVRSGTIRGTLSSTMSDLVSLRAAGGAPQRLMKLGTSAPTPMLPMQ